MRHVTVLNSCTFMEHVVRVTFDNEKKIELHWLPICSSVYSSNKRCWWPYKGLLEVGSIAHMMY